MSSFTLEIETVSTQVLEVDSGPPGQPGPPGPGHSPFTFHQSSVASVWTVVHNLGAYPEPTILLDDSPTFPVWTDIEYVDINSFILTFPSPVSGYAHIY